MPITSITNCYYSSNMGGFVSVPSPNIGGDDVSHKDPGPLWLKISEMKSTMYRTHGPCVVRHNV